MVKPLKERGLEDVADLRSRAARLLALRRISAHDYKFIDKRLEEVEERILTMEEDGVDRKEVPF